MGILLLWFVVWFIEKNIQPMNQRKCVIYDLPDDLFMNGVYQAGDEFKL